MEKPLFKKEAYHKNKILEAQKAKEFQLTEEDGNELAVIFKDNIDLLAVDSLDWRAYQNTFIYKTEDDWLKYLTNWRIKNRDWIYKFGGNYMLVSHCEDDSEFIYNDAIFKKLNNSIKYNIPFTKIKVKYPSVVYNDFQDIENSMPITTNEFNFIEVSR